MDILPLLAGPAAWLALLTLIVLEMVLVTVPIADGFDVTKGYRYGAVGFAIVVAMSNGLQRDRRKAILAVKGASA